MFDGDCVRTLFVVHSFGGSRSVSRSFVPWIVSTEGVFRFGAVWCWGLVCKQGGLVGEGISRKILNRVTPTQRLGDIFIYVIPW